MNANPPNNNDSDTKRNEMYEDLKRQYDLTAERRRTLTGQASNLLGFAGIIETILIAAIVALVTDPEARKLLTAEPYFHYAIVTLGAIGFICYIITVIFSLRAYYETKWIPAPQFYAVRGKDLEHAVVDYWDRFFIHYNRKDFAKQLAVGIEYDQQVNDKKYDNLKIASFWLMIGIIASVAAGVHFLLMSL